MESERCLRRNIHDVGSWATYASSAETIGAKKGNFGERRHYNKDVNVDYVQLHLLSLVTLYSTEPNCQFVNDSSKIQGLQTQYLNLLHKYLQYRYPQDSYARLARGMGVISKARESCKILNSFDSWLSPMKTECQL